MTIFNWLAVAASAVTLLAAGCTGRQIHNVDAPVAASKPNPSADEVKQAIMRAGTSSSWRITEAGPGQLRGMRVQTPHAATVDIAYSPQRYSITLKDSTLVWKGRESHVGPRSPEPTVHRLYNEWVQELEQQIRTQLGAL
jgi:hypothetical protein